MAVGSERRTRVSPYPDPLTVLASLSVVRAVSPLFATDLTQSAPARNPSCLFPSPPLPSPAPVPCTFSEASVAPEMKDCDRTRLASVPEESGALPPPVDGVVLSPWRGCVSTEGSADSLAEGGAVWRVSASCGFLRTRVTA